MDKSRNTKTAGLIEKSFSGFIWTFAGVGGQALFQVATLAVLARLLTPAEFGVAGTAVVITQFSNIFSELGVGPAIVQRAELTKNHIRVGFTISLILGFITAIVVFLTSSYAAFFFRVPDLDDALKVYAISFIFSGLSVVSESLLQRELKFKIISTIELASYIFGYSAVGIVMAINGFGFWALVGAHTSQALIKTVGVMFWAPSFHKLSLNKEALKDFLHFGTGLTLGRIANYLANQGDNLVIGRTLGADSLGSYGRAYQLVVMPANMFGQVFEKVLFPTLSRSQDDVAILAKAYRKSVSLITWTLIPFSVFIWELSPEIIKLVLGNQWLHLIWPFRVLSIGITFRVIHKISDALIRSMGAVYKRAILQSCYAILVIIGAWIGHYYNITGVAACVLVALICNYLMMSKLCLTLTGLGVKAFFFAHLPGIFTGMIAYVAISQYFDLLLRYEYRPIASIPLCGLVLLVSYILPFLLRMHNLVGADNMESFKSINQRLRFQGKIVKTKKGLS